MAKMADLLHPYAAEFPSNGNGDYLYAPPEWQAPGDDFAPTIESAYQKYLGRSASAEEIQGHRGNPGGVSAVLRLIEFSPEASAYKKKTTTSTTSTSTTTPTTTPGAYAGTLQGFDATKVADTAHLTPKYVFARIASQFNTQDPAQRQQMLAALQADKSGYFAHATLGGSKGDRLRIGGTLDPAFGGINEFDIFRNAGTGEWAPVWQPTGGPGFVAEPETSATPPVAGLVTPAVVPTSFTPRDYGAAANFTPVAFAPSQVGQGLTQYGTNTVSMTPEAYRKLIDAQAQPPVPVPPLSALASLPWQKKG